MERDERAILVSRWKIRARVEHEPVRRPVPGEYRGRLLLLCALLRLLAVAAVLRRQYQVMRLQRVVAVGPAEVVALVDLHQLLRRILGAVLGVERPVAVWTAELVAAVLRRPELAVERADRDPDGVPDAARKVYGVGVRLIELARIPLPDAGAGVQLRAWILARRILRPVLLLTGIARRSDVDVKRPVLVDRERLGEMVAAVRQPIDHRFSGGGRIERASLVRKAQDTGAVLGVDVAVEHRHLRRAESAGELHTLVGMAVAVRVAQNGDAAVVPAPLLRHIHVAVRRHPHVPRTRHRFGKYPGAEPRRQFQSRVIGRAWRSAGLLRQAGRSRQQNAEKRRTPRASHIELVSEVSAV